VKGSSAGDEHEYLYLTTRGRKTGHERRIEIWFTRRGRSHYLVAEHGLRAQWVQNLLVEPRVRWRVGTTAFRGRARVVRPETAPALVRDIQARSRAKYGWGDGLVVELEEHLEDRRGEERDEGDERRDVRTSEHRDPPPCSPDDGARLCHEANFRKGSEGDLQESSPSPRASPWS
jgi:deazaflavin-dependent oxidoreductase (nitroreductase family)